MRRTDRAITDREELLNTLRAGHTLSLALCGEDPYVIPMNYGVLEEDGQLFLTMHCAPEGEKLRRIEADPKAAFTVILREKPVWSDPEVACTYGTEYVSLCGKGSFSFAGTDEEKLRCLNALMAGIAPGKDFRYSDEMLRSVCVLKLRVERLTGKRRGAPL